jgi:hypothetical protein
MMQHGSNGKHTCGTINLAQIREKLLVPQVLEGNFVFLEGRLLQEDTFTAKRYSLHKVFEGLLTTCIGFWRGGRMLRYGMGCTLQRTQLHGVSHTQQAPASK